jgi:hypothetical protein
MHKNTTKRNETLSKWCKNKHGASKIIDMFETYHKVMVEQIRKRNNWKLGGAHKAIYKQLQVDIQVASIHRRSQSLCAATQ